ncbi:hypothetical protein GH733_009390 [Mirounga leonina]|nr:hypothetical protein GH733_009390 [Mirounga leonina]
MGPFPFIVFTKSGTGNIVVIMVSYPKGREILDLVQKGIAVKMTIGVGTRHVQEFISGQSVVFVAIAFITMMIISLAWLIFYYIQRFLYTGSQFGSQSHRKEAKKIIGQLPLHTVKHGEKDVVSFIKIDHVAKDIGIDVDAENCAVCIENFKVKDIIRILPCKICIDPWLLDHRTCPMCKLDVIKALGYWVCYIFVYIQSLPQFFLSDSISLLTRAKRNGLSAPSNGELEDVQEMPTPEPPLGSVLAANLSITLQDDRSEGSSLPSASASDSAPQCDASFKDEAGENTALLGTPITNHHPFGALLLSWLRVFSQSQVSWRI